MRYKETTGHLPFFKAKSQKNNSNDASGVQSRNTSGVFENGSGSNEKSIDTTIGVQGVPAAKQISE